MDTLFHLAISFLAGMAIAPRLNYRPLTVLSLAGASVLIDIDHFLFAYPRAFHTVFVAVLLPAVLFYIAYRYEQGIRYQSIIVLLTVMLLAHLSVDLFYEGAIRPFYPLMNWELVAPQLELTVTQNEWTVISPEGVLLTLNGVIVGLAYYSEKFIYFFEDQHEKLDNAVDDVLRS